jgi:hypothetical protein
MKSSWVFLYSSDLLFSILTWVCGKGISWQLQDYKVLGIPGERLFLEVHISSWGQNQNKSIRVRCLCTWLLTGVGKWNFIRCIFQFKQLQPCAVSSVHLSAHDAVYKLYVYFTYVFFFISCPFCVFSCIHKYMCICIYICVSTCKNMYIYIHTHTHIHVNHVWYIIYRKF